MATLQKGRPRSAPFWREIAGRLICPKEPDWMPGSPLRGETKPALVASGLGLGFTAGRFRNLPGPYHEPAYHQCDW